MQQDFTSEMTLGEQIGQLMVVGFSEPVVSREIRDLIQSHHVGGIILFSRNIQDPGQVLDLTNSLQAVAREAGHRFPLFIAIDQENGMVRRLGAGTTAFPGNMALGAAGSEELVRDVALATGRELKALGLNMNLAPVADVNNNPANPVIGVRSFGEDPRAVARFVSAAVKGYHAAGVIACLKHFPGHGDTAVDSHRTLPTISATPEQLEAVELVPFKSGIAAGTDCVMTAHIYFPHLMHEALPATISVAILRGLLREKLGFDGVIISDCLEMNAITDTVGAERGAVMTLQAGTDLVLISHLYERQRGAIEAIRAALQAGELSRDELRRSVNRVMRLRERYLSWETLPAAPIPQWVGGEDHRRLRDQAYERSTTLLRNEDGLLPLRPRAEERLLVLSPQGERVTLAEETGYPDRALAESIQRHCRARVEARTISLRPTGAEREKILGAAQRASVVILATMNAHFYEGQAALMCDLLQAGRRVIGIATRDPYDLLAFPRLRTYLATYEYTQPALEATVRVLFGEIQPRGKLPVSLPGLYQFD